ncbi:zinc finger protein 501-like [Protopterus annectens]|uniref:zinc finger protein 501-like n=1 Tax=Protopterus annectens TaxID=7888 RepID=UPI001CFB3CF8|nr:zinc finger protein 501-like [Protopterus annectens]XP_043934365.1 zinc finger protein 501-like [Protopterus annectens]XP_043934366.1 zinc finger protein 501-like [Protopterus annectens]XP_043934367.1 zinc finger protein 501-like [Protopterus annectens]XP_043934368.1 zinc finger protein 501-like [Protopterus annectens]XP_043934369.1 zinc finger protein 501-like [Protopterus annectens]XP_043934370.1 zinc finger protein 501-like [Protopterus annectens]
METVLPLTKMECLLNIKEEPEQDYTSSSYQTPMELSLSLPKMDENLTVVKKEEPEQQAAGPNIPKSEYELSYVSKCRIHKSFSRQKSLKCVTCKNKFTDCWALYKHRILVHRPFRKPDGPFKVMNSTDAVKFQHINSLFDEHQKKSQTSGEKACVLCESSFKPETQYCAHQCTDCDKVFKSKSDLTVHQKTHVGIKYFKCDKCGSGFKLHLNFIRHQQITCKRTSYTCRDCKKCFTSKTELADHTLVHRREKPFNCAACGNYFKTKIGLALHRRSCIQAVPFRCTECNEGFMQVADLTAHMRLHFQETIHRYYGINLPAQPRFNEVTNELKCVECGKHFKHKYRLIKHRWVHSKNNGNMCDSGGSFERKQSVTEHQQLHAGEQPYKCTICKSRLQTKKSLSNHNRLHCSMFKCTYCRRRFRNESSLKWHEYAHSKEKDRK